MQAKKIWTELQEENIQLVAVTKKRSLDEVQHIYDLGMRHFGENRVQEMLSKMDDLPSDIKWHQIGHLQRNKVKSIVEFIHLIHSADSFRLIKEINKQAKKINRKIDVLLQFKIAEEDSKYGFETKDSHEIIKEILSNNYSFVNIRGLMGMASLTDNEDQIASEFRQLKNIFDQYKSEYFNDSPDFDTLSMGMSSDYKIAIKQGATMVRIGSALFKS